MSLHFDRAYVTCSD